MREYQPSRSKKQEIKNFVYDFLTTILVENHIR